LTESKNELQLFIQDYNLQISTNNVTLCNPVKNSP